MIVFLNRNEFPCFAGSFTKDKSQINDGRGNWTRETDICRDHPHAISSVVATCKKKYLCILNSNGQKLYFSSCAALLFPGRRNDIL